MSCNCFFKVSVSNVNVIGIWVLFIFVFNIVILFFNRFSVLPILYAEFIAVVVSNCILSSLVEIDVSKSLCFNFISSGI